MANSAAIETNKKDLCQHQNEKHTKSKKTKTKERGKTNCVTEFIPSIYNMRAFKRFFSLLVTLSIYYIYEWAIFLF
jgi:hypothetical protein